MTMAANAWGTPPSLTYDRLAEPFRPIFQRIAAEAVQRDRERRLPHDQLAWLRQAGFTALRIPVEHGGLGATLPELFGLLSELAEADSNLTQALRAHFGFVEDLLNTADTAWRDRWYQRIVAGETVGSGWSETGNETVGKLSTTLTRDGDHWRINGQKFYTTGSYFADWIGAGAVDGDGDTVSALVSTRAEGVDVIDDWDGFGQKMTGSGTAKFADSPVDDDQVRPASERFVYRIAFFQLVHLATLAGIGRAAANEVAQAVAERPRTYSHAAAAASRQDPQVLQVVGRVRALAYAAGAIVAKAAQATQTAFEAGQGTDAGLALALSEIEVAQAQVVVPRLILDAATILFDALGASASRGSRGFDRHWRNARTLSSHNPLIYKERIIGDYAVNGTPPPLTWFAEEKIAAE
ncbi:acyl-CoA dehydrogenase family protein [Acidisphaera sp. S103]|uniref:acyl-CoA dehydrogenase family protein n=1 Tax=Acidisphaera sp. S103 TaxID=1747223 RepID=UPI00131DAB85|nr:acyl-CoA dehydrogenase family protein [Acidisphaera sp. S103]